MGLASHDCSLLVSVREAVLHAFHDVHGVVLVIILNNDLGIVNNFVNEVKKTPVDEHGVNFSVPPPLGCTFGEWVFAVVPEPGAALVLKGGLILRAIW